MVSQNSPFNPIYDAWKCDSRQILPMDIDLARKQVEIIDAKVLSNRKPPYPIAGGLYDALKDSMGDVMIASNEKLREASLFFEQTEGIDIHPAAGVAVATLIEAVKDNLVEKEAVIMLNITGGGEARFMAENKLFYLKPDYIFDFDPDPEYVKDKVEKLFT